MPLTISAVFVFGLATWFCWRTFGMRVSHALCAGLFGFYLAQSGLAPTIRNLVAHLFAWLGTWRL